MAKKTLKGKPAKKVAKPARPSGKKAAVKKTVKSARLSGAKVSLKTASKKPVKLAKLNRPNGKTAPKKIAAKKTIKPVKKIAAKKTTPKKAIKIVKKIVGKANAKKVLIAKKVTKVIVKKVSKPAKKVIAKKIVAKKATAKKVVAKKAISKKVVKPAKKAPVEKILKTSKKVNSKEKIKLIVKPIKPLKNKEIPAKPIEVVKPAIVIAKKPGPVPKKKQESTIDQEDSHMDESPMIVEYKSPPSIRRPLGPTPTPHINTDTRTRYSDAELKEFKELILKKLSEAQKDYELLKSTLSHRDDHGTDDTSPTFKLLEDGSDVLSKEETSHLAGRQEKFIQNLQNALIRIENKTYGICRATGKLISKERLRSVPHATLAIEAKLIQHN